MARGRKKLPTATLKLRDTFRRDRRSAAEPVPDVVAPECPACLSNDAKTEWFRIVPMLQNMRLLAQTDLVALADYCQAWGDWQAGRRNVQRLGYFVKGAAGGMVANPALRVQDKASQRMLKLAVQFGLTPVARASMHPPGHGKETPATHDPKKRYFAR